MDLKTFARLEDGTVAEIFRTAVDVSELFHPAVAWRNITEHPEVKIGWTHDGASFSPPSDVTAPTPPSLAELQAQLNAIEAQIGRVTTDQ